MPIGLGWQVAACLLCCLSFGVDALALNIDKCRDIDFFHHYKYTMEQRICKVWQREYSRTSGFVLRYWVRRQRDLCRTLRLYDRADVRMRRELHLPWSFVRYEGEQYPSTGQVVLDEGEPGETWITRTWNEGSPFEVGEDLD